MRSRCSYFGIDLLYFHLTSFSSRFYLWCSRLGHVSAPWLKYGPSPIATKGGSIYYVSFIDDHTRYCWVYLLKRQSDFIHVYSTFHSFVETQHFVIIKCFRCDLGKEYTSTVFSELLISDGIVHQSSCIDTPQQNGVVKRRYRHIIKTAHSLLLFASVPSVF